MNALFKVKNKYDYNDNCTYYVYDIKSNLNFVYFLIFNWNLNTWEWVNADGYIPA